jgi:phospholipid transport system substrate-binding protein
MKQMMKVLKSVLIAALLLAGSLVVAEEAIPLLIVQDTSTRMLASLKAEKEAISKNPERLQALVSEIMLPYFDFRRMSQWVLGRAWKSASDIQREKFVNEFRTLLMRTYGRALAEYVDEKVIYLPYAHEDGNKKVRVRTEIERSGGIPISISYSMYLRDGEWKVYDVSIDGVSLVMNYRSTFGRTIKKEGLDTLIKQLVDHNSGQV